MSNELADLLGDRFGLENRYGYFSADALAELQYEDSIVLPDGTEVKLLEQGIDYSELDPDCNPMSVVFEFQFKSGTRWLEVYGHYVSHDGGYWDGHHEVTQKTKEVTYYE